MDSDSEDEEWKERSDEFLRKLYAFHERNGSPIRRLPTLGGRELNLYRLYSKVREMKGAEKITRKRQWGEVARSFNLPRSVTSASYAIRQHYIRYLEKFEAYENDPNFANYFHTSTSLPAVKAPPTAPHPHPLSHSFTASDLHTVQPSPASQSWTQQNVPKATTTSLSTIPTFQRPSVPGDSVSVGGGKECDKLVRSLLSGFPNEVDFALNVLTMMSFDKPSALPITKVPYLLDVLLAHLAVFPEEDFGLEILFMECWSKCSEMDFIKFWEKSVPEWVYDVIFPQQSGKDTADFSLPTECTLTVYRVSQIANILRNLSFESQHAQFLSHHNATLRFLYLSCNCSVPTVRSFSLDTLANLAPHILLPADVDDSFSIVSLLFNSVHQWILSNDKLAVLRGLEVLGELAWCLRNEVMISGTPHNVYRRLFELLLLPDCLLLLTTLNTMYNLTLLSDQTADAILAVNKSLSILISLLTLRVESFGAEALSGLKLIDTAAPLGNKVTSSVGSTTTSTTTKQASATSSVKASSGGGVHVRVVPGGNVVQLSTTTGGSKQAVAKGGGGSSLGSSRSHKNNSNAVSHSLKIGNTVIPTLNMGASKKLQDQGGTTTLSPLLQSSSSNPVVKAIFSSSIGPLTLEQLQSLLVKNIPTLPQTTSVAQKSVGVVASASQNSIRQPVNSAMSSKSAPSLVNSSLKVTSDGTVQLPAKVGTNAPGGLSAESYATVWLKSSFEESRGSYVTQMDVYSQYIKSCADANQSQMLNLTDFTKCVKNVFPNSLSTRITFANQVVYMIAGLARKKVTSIVTQRDVSSPSLHSLVASPVSSRTPSPSLPGLAVSSSTSTVPPPSVTATAVPQPLLKVKAQSHSPSPSPATVPLQNDQVSLANLDTKVSTVIPTSIPSSNHLPLSASNPLLKSSQDRSNSSSPLPHNTALQLSASPSPSPSVSSNHIASNRVLQLTKSRESSISPSPLSRVSLSPAPSLQGSAVSSQSLQIKPRDSISPTPPPPPSSVPPPSPSPSQLQNIILNSADHNKSSLSSSSISSLSSHQTSLSNSNRPPTPNSFIKSKLKRDTESPSSPRPIVHHGASLSSVSSSSLQSSNSSLSSSKLHDYLSLSSSSSISTDELASAIPESKRIRLTNDSNGHDVIGNKLTISRTPSPQVFSKEKVKVNGNGNSGDKVKLIHTTSASSSIATSTSVMPLGLMNSTTLTGQTGLTSSTCLTGQTGLTSSTLTGPTRLTSSTLTGKTCLTTSTKSAFTPASVLPGNVLPPTRITSSAPAVLSNGTRMTLTDIADISTHHLDVTGDKWSTYKVGVVQNVASIHNKYEDTLEATGPFCMWRGCTRRCSSQYSLFSHLVYDHLPELPSYPSGCLWQGCSHSNTKRMRPSLMTHLQTHHCCLEPVPPPLNVAKTLHQLRFISPFQSEEESPLTKAVRLTAALVLRNLARMSTKARNSLRSYESQLCQVALSDNEASVAISQCLHFISIPPSSLS